jgi:hypothetical protein
MTQDSAKSELQRQLNTAIGAGYRLIRRGQTAAGCDQWLRAWEVVKQLTTADIRSTEAFDRWHRSLSEHVSDWCQDFEMELGNAGRDDPHYHEERVRYVREFLPLFPDESSLVYLNMRRAEGEALWALDRRAEAEAGYAALVERQPDEAWAYIGWADRYWLLDDSPKAYDAAEALMQRGLARPNLQDRTDLLERLTDLYDEWGKPAERDATLAQMAALRNPPARHQVAAAPPPAPEFLPPEASSAPGRAKLGRNDPCWCGSGVKYKRCHLRSDQQAR